MNFENLIADLVEKIDKKDRPRKEAKRALARSLPLSTDPPAVEVVHVDDVSSANADESVALEQEISRGRLNQSVRVDLDYKDLSVRLTTEQSIAIEVCTLRAQVATLAEHLAHANCKLDQSHRKIGFLEAQVLIQDEQIRQLKLEQRDSAKKKRTSKTRQSR
jgi:hypothetical protein